MQQAGLCSRAYKVRFSVHVEEEIVKICGIQLETQC